MTFDFAPSLADGALSLEPLVESDRAGLTEAASDPLIWAGHPSKGRWRSDVFAGYFGFLLKRGGALTIREQESGSIIGCSRYYPVPDAPDDVGIGFTFLIRRHWGGKTNLRLKTLMLDHAFRFVPRVWFHIGPENIRSQKATAKFGALPAASRSLDISGSAVLWACYVLDKNAWATHSARPPVRADEPLPDVSTKR